jgi:hypothetical protein
MRTEKGLGQISTGNLWGAGRPVHCLPESGHENEAVLGSAAKHRTARENLRVGTVVRFVEMFDNAQFAFELKDGRA